MRAAALSMKSLLVAARKSRMKKILVVAIVLMLLFLPGIARAIDSQITTYYWDGGWVEHASWTTTLPEDLYIQILAWSWQPEFSPLHVQFDNVITSEGLLDDFDDGTINTSIWHTHASEGATLEETGGVLDVDVPAGPTSDGKGRCGGVTSRDRLHGNWDVQVDFSLNAEYHATPNTNTRLFITDQSDHGIDIWIHSGYYVSRELRQSTHHIAETPTDHLNGKLRITRTGIVEIDIKPGSHPNSINLKSKGVVPVAILSADDFAAPEVDPVTVTFADAAPVKWALEDVDDDGDMDMILHFRTRELTLNASSTEATLVGTTKGGIDFAGTD
ncbi:MAG: hypothetical protein JSW27_07120 [Phycisphaerales bacterium]|nr:MAG: hypothetical protein JSW27_07120 [Phycisphaerales bacterium]